MEGVRRVLCIAPNATLGFAGWRQATSNRLLQVVPESTVDLLEAIQFSPGADEQQISFPSGKD